MDPQSKDQPKNALKVRIPPEITVWKDSNWTSKSRHSRTKHQEARHRLERVSPKVTRPRMTNLSPRTTTALSPRATNFSPRSPSIASFARVKRSSNLSPRSPSVVSFAQAKRTRKASRSVSIRERSQHAEIKSPISKNVPLIAEPKPRNRLLHSATTYQSRSLSPSQASVLSTQTQTTGTSSSSSQTITQDSYNQSRKEVSQTIDVFQYLVQDNNAVATKDTSTTAIGVLSEEEEWDSDSSSSSGTPCDRTCCATPESDRRSARSSGMWDSGISMGGDSPEFPMKARPAVSYRGPSPPDYDASRRFSSPRYLQASDAARYPVQVPLFQHPGRSPLDRMPPPAYPQGQVQRSSPSQSPPQTTTTLRRKPAGYELLANNLKGMDLSGESEPSRQQPTPMYRKFESLQHRTLLHLQDTLSELESELNMLDENIAPYMVDQLGQPIPQSRRQDKMHPGTMGYRRHQVLDMVSHYLGQYNQLVSTQGQMQARSAIPTPEQIDAYKQWMAEARPVAGPEAAFLDHTDDLILHKRPGSQRDTGYCGPSSPNIQIIMSIQSGILLMIVLSWLSNWGVGV